MEVKALWSYQVKNWLRQFAWYLGIIVAISLAVSVLALRFVGNDIFTDFVFPLLKFEATISFVWISFYMVGKMIERWRFLVESGFERRQLFQQGLIISLAFSALWSLFIYCAGLVSFLQKNFIFTFDIGDYGQAFAVGTPRIIGNYVLTFALIFFIFTIAFLIDILYARLSPQVFMIMLIIYGGVAIFLARFFSNNYPARKFLASITGKNPNGINRPVPLLITAAVLILIIWLINWRLWRHCESKITAK